MKPIRTVVKQNGLYATIRSGCRNFDKYKSICIMCYGCPSHPMDHVPYNYDRFFDDGYIFVFPHYYGTWGSDGYCTFDNSVNTIIDLIDLIEGNALINSYDNTAIMLSGKNISIIGASYGGHVALCAGGLSHQVNNIIALSPVVDWSGRSKPQHSDLKKLTIHLQGEYANLRRCKKDSLRLFAAGNLQYTAKKQLKDLANKDVLIMHGVDDPQVNRESSKNYVLRLSSISSRRSEFYKIDGAGHLLLHDLSSPLIYRYIDDFLNINYES